MEEIMNLESLLDSAYRKKKEPSRDASFTERGFWINIKLAG